MTSASPVGVVFKKIFGDYQSMPLFRVKNPRKTQAEKLRQTDGQ